MLSFTFVPGCNYFLLYPFLFFLYHCSTTIQSQISIRIKQNNFNYETENLKITYFFFVFIQISNLAFLLPDHYIFFMKDTKGTFKLIDRKQTDHAMAKKTNTKVQKTQHRNLSNWNPTKNSG